MTTDALYILKVVALVIITLWLTSYGLNKIKAKTETKWVIFLGLFIVCWLSARPIIKKDWADMKTVKEKSLAEEKERQKAATVVRARNPTMRDWEYGWSKLPHVRGLDPTIRKESHPAKILYYDQVRFDFVVFLPNGTRAEFTWNKFAHATNGVWQQPVPPNHGEWFLEPDNPADPSPTIFKGWGTDKGGEAHINWLRAKN
ncbi:MAG: hypothetical protein A3D56_02185 [Candidatus Taylorbacteria bacterium RIFCSPHIGHO2_02_FULL_45_35]|uniref:Uncharacterized protein n=1 Tax=Candidatus Taylorbacteria bacterium RIFCSPHIGHO2_02_FULL_45_35 TaxID=1802311 RepID=A0A1G2MUZ5_9BACT|nr:MAG: hypothetical protein A3D56_02185 [Candidatus Taylorbacteria bacterium RIFCSPHIGHO2_02_FULL_45_35]OHA32522.1 MAG: hypothetical protein A3A22_03230 [Candidatus Taylorbacteria bacterium RIFCSPLOWO2_01_FULL_45_34b]